MFSLYVKWVGTRGGGRLLENSLGETFQNVQKRTFLKNKLYLFCDVQQKLGRCGRAAAIKVTRDSSSASSKLSFSEKSVRFVINVYDTV